MDLLQIMGETNFNSDSGVYGNHFFELLASKSAKKPYYSSLIDFHTDVAKELGEDHSFYTIDLADVLWKAQLWKETFPDILPYYAVKANPDKVVLRLFVLLGYGFDCSTEGEMRLVLKAGGDAKKIIFANTIKTPKALKYASSVGVDLMTFDSKEELIKIHKHFPNTRLIIRVKSKSSQVLYNLSMKFGCEMTEAEELLRKAKELKLNVIGVSFHVGALCEDPATFTSSIDNAGIITGLAKAHGFKFTIIDIGAGFYGSKQKEHLFPTFVQKIKRSLKANFTDMDVQFIAEPGCYYVCSAASLTTTIIGKKSADAETTSIQRQYYINNGIYGSLFDHKWLYDIIFKPLLKSEELKKRSVYKSMIWGETCSSEDVIDKECYVPDMEEGEMLLWENVGAYSSGVCSTFTQVPYPATRHVFIRNARSRLDWIENFEEVCDFILEEAILVECEDLPENQNPC